MVALRFFKGRPWIDDSTSSLIKLWEIRDGETYADALQRAFDAYPSGFVLLEHDIAVSASDLVKFYNIADGVLHGSHVLVANYELYEHSPIGLISHSAHRVIVDGRPIWLENHATADYFGFGMIYIPSHVWKLFYHEMPFADYPTLDSVFSDWLHKKTGQTAFVCPGITAIHLHY